MTKPLCNICKKPENTQRRLEFLYYYSKKGKTTEIYLCYSEKCRDKFNE